MAPSPPPPRRRRSASSSPKQVGLIKGYLPVRILFPPSSSPAAEEEDDDEAPVVLPPHDETFCYVKEHQGRGANNDGDDDDDDDNDDDHKPTLFVANAPSYPPSGIDTATLLRALVGRFATVQRVTVVPAEHKAPDPADRPSSHDDWYFRPCPTDRFAHVVLASRKDLQRCLRALATATDGLTVDAVERQTLADAVAQRAQPDDDDDDAMRHNNDDDEHGSGLQRVWQNYRRQQARHADRQALLAQCNAVMQAYEQREAERQAQMSSEPDADGFVTVTHSTQPATTPVLQQTPGRRRRRSRKRHSAGAHPLDDFYRFQTKARRQNEVQTLRERFQEDVDRLQKKRREKSAANGSGGGWNPFAE